METNKVTLGKKLAISQSYYKLASANIGNIGKAKLSVDSSDAALIAQNKPKDFVFMEKGGKRFSMDIEDLPSSAHKEHLDREVTHNRQGIAYVPISGILVDECDWWDSWIYGLCSMKRIERVVLALAESKMITHIVLDVNSPGGMLYAKTLSDTIYSIAQNKKPVWASVADAYSAALWIISGATKIVAQSALSGFGSVGVLMEHWDYSKMLENDGITAQYLVSDNSQKKIYGNALEPLSAEARNHLITELNNDKTAFVSDLVSRRSGLRANSSFFDGGTYPAVVAERYGMVDHIAKGTDHYEYLQNLIKREQASQVLGNIDPITNATLALKNNQTMTATDIEKKFQATDEIILKAMQDKKGFVIIPKSEIQAIASEAAAVTVVEETTATEVVEETAVTEVVEQTEETAATEVVEETEEAAAAVEQGAAGEETVVEESTETATQTAIAKIAKQAGELQAQNAELSSKMAEFTTKFTALESENTKLKVELEAETKRADAFFAQMSKSGADKGVVVGKKAGNVQKVDETDKPKASNPHTQPDFTDAYQVHISK